MTACTSHNFTLLENNIAQDLVFLCWNLLTEERKSDCLLLYVLRSLPDGAEYRVLQHDLLYTIALNPNLNFLLKYAYRIGLIHELEAPSHWANGRQIKITVSSISESIGAPSLILAKIE